MKSEMTFLKTFIASIFALIVATSCSDESFDGNVEYNERIDFAVASSDDWQVIDNNKTTRASVTTNENFSRFRVAAIAEDKTTKERTMLMKYQLVEKQSNGTWTYTPTKYWPSTQQYSTSFYAYAGKFKRIEQIIGDDAPWEKAVVVMSDTAENQQDFIVARYTANDCNKVNLKFDHALTAIKIKTVNIKRPILSIELTGVYDAGEFNFKTWEWENQRYSDVSKGFNYNFIGSELEGKSDSNGIYIKDGNSSEIYLLMIPQDLSASGRNAHLRVLFDNGTVVEQKLAQNWQKGEVYTYVIDYQSNSSCQWLDDSNCYLINPLSENNNTTKNVFAIPISTRINTFWVNEGTPREKPLVDGIEYVAEVIWQDSPQRQIWFTDKTGSASYNTYDATVTSDNEYVYFKLATPNFTGTSNVVVGVKKKGEETYLWSWHLWLSDYYPTPSSASKPENACRIQVRNGYIERYEDPNNPDGTHVSWNSSDNIGRYFMDRIIGAKAAPKPGEYTYTNEDYKASFGMYYQYGRKDPFPPNGTLYKIDGSVLGSITDDNSDLITSGNLHSYDGNTWPLVETVQNPMQFVTSDYSSNNYPLGANWNNPSWWKLSDHGNKSFYDPCPPGWQLPQQGLFDIVCPKHDYVSDSFFSNSLTDGSCELLQIGEKIIGMRLGMSKDNSLKVDMLSCNIRSAYNGRWVDYNNTFLWYNSDYKVFNYIYSFQDHTDEYIIWVNKKLYDSFNAGCIRAFHK